ncbi:MAG: glutamate 5-kinase [Chloroflexota bacterium]
MERKRIVAKFGTGLLTGGGEKLDKSIMASLAAQVAELHDQGRELVIVSSGAVAAGKHKLGLKKKARRDIPFKQVLASVGQSQLMHAYEELFSSYSIIVAQALLTRQVLVDRAGYLNARNTLLALLEQRVICIVNENDVVAVEELDGITFGDNDNLSAMVANLIDADMLVLLGDTGGLFTADPHKDTSARLIPLVEDISERIEGLAGGTQGGQGTGGMITKIEAAKLATASGIPVVIADGREPEALLRIARGEQVGTLFLSRAATLESKKRWLLTGLACKGRLTVDAGAVRALREMSSSLLPGGIVGAEAGFSRGDVVDIVDEGGNRVACGIVNYSAAEVCIIKGCHSSGICERLGYEYGVEVVHRNNMVVL